jgi:polyhydroxyalkanoate synthesis regulator phasin
MSPQKPSARRESRDRPSQRSLAEQLIGRTLDPLAVVMLTRERIHETLEDAVKRGRVTRTDANDLAGELLRRGRQQTEELLAEIERALQGSRGRGDSATARSRLSGGVTRLARTADKARRTVGGGSFPISDYDGLTARQVQGQLAGLTPAQLRQVREYERRHANRKTVLDAIARGLGS